MTPQIDEARRLDAKLRHPPTRRGADLAKAGIRRDDRPGWHRLARPERFELPTLRFEA